MPKYTHFNQHQADIFELEKCASGIIGTTHVGPCIVFYLFDPRTKRCLGMHLDALCSFNSIANSISQFVPNFIEKGLSGYQAFLVGGWPGTVDFSDQLAYENRLPLVLEALQVDLERHLFKFDQKVLDFSPHGFYDFVGFDLNSGNLIIRKDKGHEFTPIEESEESKNAYRDCKLYATNSTSISKIMVQLFRNNVLQKATLSTQTNEFLERVIKAKDGTPFIPVHKIPEQIQQEQVKLATAVQAKNAVKVLELLFSNFADPSTPILRSQNWTPLHYACSMLNREPANYALKVIVLALIMKGKIDKEIVRINKETGAESKTFAIAMLQNPELKTFKEECEKLLKLYEIKHISIAAAIAGDNRQLLENDLLLGTLAQAHEVTMLLIAQDAIDYPNKSALEQRVIESRLLGHVRWCFTENRGLTKEHAEPKKAARPPI